MSSNRAFGLITFSFALVDNRLEHITAGREDQNDGPDLERRLGGRGGDVRWGFVGTGWLAGLAQAGGVGAGDAEGAARDEGRTKIRGKAEGEGK